MKSVARKCRETGWLKKGIATALLAVTSMAAANAQQVKCVCTAGHAKTAARTNACKPAQHTKTINHHTATAAVMQVRPVYQATPQATAAVQNEPPCYTYRKHNIVVTECPGLMFDNEDRLSWSSDKGYSGYQRSSHMDTTQYRSSNPAIAPQSNVLTEHRGPAPADGNTCAPDCSSFK